MPVSRITLLTAAALAAAALTAPAAEAASAVTPLTLSRLPVLNPAGHYAPGEDPFVDVRVHNPTGRAVRRGGGRLLVHLTRRATTRPTGRPNAAQPLPAIPAGDRRFVGVQLRLAAEGRFRLVACVTQPGKRKRCAVAKGPLTVRAS